MLNLVDDIKKHADYMSAATFLAIKHLFNFQSESLVFKNSLVTV